MLERHLFADDMIFCLESANESEKRKKKKKRNLPELMSPAWKQNK